MLSTSKTLYIHGLDGHLNDEKHNILSKHTEIIAPLIDYRANPNSYYDLLALAKQENVDYIIGTSMGGCMGYYLSLHLKLPGLLFNPALPFRSVGIDLPNENPIRSSYLKVVLGGQDDIINPLNNLAWIIEREEGEMDIAWRNTLGHRIPVDVFDEEVGAFYGKLI